MKKKLCLILSVLFTLTMGMTAMATPSTSTEVKEESSTVNADGTKTSVLDSGTGTKVTVTAPNTKTTSQGVVTSAQVATGSGLVLAFTDAAGKKLENVTLTIKAASDDVITKVLNGTTTGTAVKAADVLAALDIKAAEFTGGTATIPLKVENVTQGEKVYGIHIKADGTSEYISATATANGVVSITTSSFSPIIIVKGEAPVATPDNSVTDNTDTNKSPQTGEAVPFVMFMAVLCLAGGAYCTKKFAFNR